MTAQTVFHAAGLVAAAGARAVAASQAHADRFVQRKLDGAAEALSRAAVLQARCDLANAAALRWGGLLFETTPGGRLLNVAPTGQIIIPSPWSRTRHAEFGLTDADGRVLGAWVRNRLGELPGRWRALIYDPSEGRWFLSTKYAPATAEGFAAWWHDHMLLTVDGWIAAAAVAGLQRGKRYG